jgi:hypothetical protein
MPETIENTIVTSPSEIAEHFDRLLEHIESLKSDMPWNDNGTYSPLQQAAYHLCQCRNLIEAFEESAGLRRKRNGLRS